MAKLQTGVEYVVKKGCPFMGQYYKLFPGDIVKIIEFRQCRTYSCECKCAGLALIRIGNRNRKVCLYANNNCALSKRKNQIGNYRPS